MTVSKKQIVLAAAITTLVGLGGAAYAGGGYGQHRGQEGGMPFMRGMMFWAMDRNDDGFIDRAEIDMFRGRMFDRMDTDSDGKITQDEMKAHQMSHRQGDRGNRHGRRGYGRDGEHRGGMGRHSGMGRHDGGYQMGGRHGGEMMFWFLDRNEDGFVDRAEIDAYRTKRFENMDNDGDGKITREEIEERMDKRRGRGNGRHGEGQGRMSSRGEGRGQMSDGGEGRGQMFGRGERMFDRADANDDDTVTLEEFLAVEPPMFTRMDEDGDGKVSEAEAKDARMPRGDRMFKRADADNDGVVTREEFLAMEPRMFTRADKDGDGKVSEAEAEEMRSRMGGHYGGRHYRENDDE